MIFKTEQDLTCENVEVLIRYAKMNKRVQRLIALIQSVDSDLRLYQLVKKNYLI